MVLLPPPPPNVRIPACPAPDNPITLEDISNARQYQTNMKLDHYGWSDLTSILKKLMPISAEDKPTRDQISEVDVYVWRLNQALVTQEHPPPTFGPSGLVHAALVAVDAPPYAVLLGALLKR